MLNGWYASNPVFQGPWDSLTRSSRHSPGRGIVAEHVGDDEPGNAEGGSHFGQFGAEFAQQRAAIVTASQEQSVVRNGAQKSEEAQAVDKLTNGIVDRDETLCV